MRPAVGTRDQIVAHMHVLSALDRKARRLQKYVETTDTIEDPMDALYENGLLSVMPFFKLVQDQEHEALSLDDDIVHPIRIDHEKPHQSLWEISQCFRLPEASGEYHAWHDAIAARYEKEARLRHHQEIIETDGFTCWVLAPEGMKGHGETQQTMARVKREISDALAERRMPEGKALESIRKGHSRLAEPGSNAVAGTAHWEYGDGEGYSAIAKTEISSMRSYEGLRITSSCRFNARCSLEGSVLKLSIPAIPEATVLSLPGKTLEQVVNDPRLHGWGISTLGLMRNQRATDQKGNEISDISLDTNRGDGSSRLCFSTARRNE